MNNDNEQKDREQEIIEAQKRQISILRSGNTGAILDTLIEIREEGNINILPDIFELMLVSEEPEVQKSCANLLCDIKVDEAGIILTEAISDSRYESIKKELVSACWQNGLDYHKSVLIFAEIVLSDDYSTAIEAFTVVENCIGDLSETERANLSSALKKGMEQTDSQRKDLVNALIVAIEEF